MAGVPKHPKSALHEFYQHHIGQPEFDIVEESLPPAPPQFKCRVTIPPVLATQGGFEQASFEGDGPSKKKAEHWAATKALEYIRSKGFVVPNILAIENGKAHAPAAGTPVTSEVAELRSQVATLASQLQELQGAHQQQQQLLAPGGSGRLILDEPQILPMDLDSLTPEQLRRHLQDAQAENQALQAELRREVGRREQAMAILAAAGRSH